MANFQLFQSFRGKSLPAATEVNQEKAIAYEYSAKHKLAQYAVTGCLNQTFYASAETQLKIVLALCQEIEPLFVAKTALYCREKGQMKDMPALLTAALSASTNGRWYLPSIFPRVIDNGKMLRNFVQIMRSGLVGRKSLGTRPKVLVQQWLNTASEKALIDAAVGNTPSLADVVKMVHPKPVDAMREAFFAWLIGKPYTTEALPAAIQAFERYKADKASGVPAVPFQMLTALNLQKEEWAQIAHQAGWQMVRMNLNTFARHGVFEIDGMAEVIATKLKDAKAIRKVRVLPYQLLMAYQAASKDIPQVIREALHDALEVAVENVPSYPGRVVVCPDVSGSMSSPVTGHRKGSTSAVRCIDVAALVAAAFVRKNAQTVVLPFENKVCSIRLDPRDSIMTNAEKLAAIGGGGTNCSAPLAWLNTQKEHADLVVFVSDNESWVDNRKHGTTEMMRQWELFKQKNRHAKLVCLDLQPYGTTQAAEREDILNIGGFSDTVFTIIDRFACGQLGAEHWVGEIERMEI